MAVYPFRTSNFAQNIYLIGSVTFSSIPQEYVVPVKQYAADKYYIDEIDNALAQGWISQQVYDDTIALKDPQDPQYRLVAASVAPEEQL